MKNILYFKNSVNLIFCGVWHRISTEDDLRILQYDVLQGVSKRVGFALEDKRAAVLLSPAVASKHHLKREKITGFVNSKLLYRS